jgi:hypothetical protein
MTAFVRNLWLAFYPAEDRLILRVVTAGEVCHRLFLTRRFTRLLWDALVKSLERDPRIRDADPRAREALLSMQHGDAIKPDDIRAEPMPDDGDETTPLLVTRYTCKAAPEGRTSLVFEAKDIEPVHLVLSDKSLHALCQMILNATRNAEWDLDLTIGDTAKIASTGSTQVH